MRHRISPATVIASAALFFSLSGTGLAASHYLITSASQIKPSVRHQLAGQRGLQGVQGPVGDRGPAGPAGASAAAVSIQHLYSPTATVTPASPTFVLTLNCPAGMWPVSGGFAVQGAVVDSYGLSPNSNLPTWTLTGHLDSSASTGTARLRALCATLS